MIVNRAEFIKIFEEYLGSPIESIGKILFIPEEDLEQKMSWFICTRPVGASSNKTVYWNWVNNHLNGKIRCFSSSDTDEWWGFQNKDDIVIWMLRWT